MAVKSAYAAVEVVACREGRMERRPRASKAGGHL